MKKFLIALFVIGAATTVAAQERDGNSISAARELYASARYDEALAVLNGLRPSENAAVGGAQGDRTVPLAVSARARPGHRGGERDCRCRDRRSVLRADRKRSVAPRPLGVHRRPHAVAAEHRDHDVRVRQAGVRAQRTCDGGKEVPRPDYPSRRSADERADGRHAHRRRRVPRARDRRGGAAARAEESRAPGARRGGAAARGSSVEAEPSRRSTPAATPVWSPRSSSARCCRIFRPRLPA